MDKIVTIGANASINLDRTTLATKLDLNRTLTEELIATTALDADTDCGKTFFLNAATEFTTTLPAIADAGAGWNCKFIV